MKCGSGEGLSRQKTLIDQVKKGFGNDRTLIVNAGNNFDPAAHDASLAASYIVKALGLGRTEVIAPGLSELAMGLETVTKMAAAASVPVVSANINGVLPYVVLPKKPGPHQRAGDIRDGSGPAAGKSQNGKKNDQ